MRCAPSAPGFVSRFGAGSGSATATIRTKLPASSWRPSTSRRSSSGCRRSPRRLEQLRKAGRTRASLTDPDSRFLRDRRGFTLGYTVTVAVSEDHLIVEQRVTQAPTDNAALVPTVEAVEQRCGERPPPGQRRQRLLHLERSGRAGPAWHRRLCARLHAGTRTESGTTRARRRSGLPPGASSDAAEVAQPHRARDLPTTESDRGAGDRGAERATRDAALPSARAGEGGGGTGAGRHSLQPDPTVACPPSAAGRSVGGPPSRSVGSKGSKS